jgi:hypothetical protein
MLCASFATMSSLETQPHQGEQVSRINKLLHAHATASAAATAALPMVMPAMAPAESPFWCIAVLELQPKLTKSCYMFESTLLWTAGLCCVAAQHPRSCMCSALRSHLSALCAGSTTTPKLVSFNVRR